MTMHVSLTSDPASSSGRSLLLHLAPATPKPKSTVRLQELLAMHSLSQSGLHQLTEDPGAAEMIVLAGDFEGFSEAVANPLLREYPEKTFAYSEIDSLVPYAPGVYPSAGKSGRLPLGRTASHMYLSRYGSSLNCEIRHRPNEPKDLLCFFRGRRDCAARNQLLNQKFNRGDVQVAEAAGFMHWRDGLVGKAEAQIEYADRMARSHFALCPRGMGLGSIRLFEAMEMGIAPVLIADGYALPPGPAWHRFLLVIPEKSIPHIPAILDAHVHESRERGQAARLAWQQFFSPQVVFDRIVEQFVEVRNRRRLTERSYRRLWPVIAAPTTLRVWKSKLRGSA